MRLGSSGDAAALVRKLQQNGQLILVAIDGHSAAGKSTFARNLQNTLSDVQLVHGDDFYRVMPGTERFGLDASNGYKRYFDWERLEQLVISPLRNEQKAYYRAYDWSTSTLGDTKIVRPRGTVIIEGIFSARPELRSYYDAIFLVETGRENQSREARAARRCDRLGGTLGRRRKVLSGDAPAAHLRRPGGCVHLVQGSSPFASDLDKSGSSPFASSIKSCRCGKGI